MRPEFEEAIGAADLPEKTREQLRTYLADREVTKEEFNTILDRVIREYMNTRIEACEAVGVIAAQSIGEPGTQMTMRTFPLRGSGGDQRHPRSPSSHRDHGRKERTEHPHNDDISRGRVCNR